jgi:benzoyl-CoA reductase/2-hydroxyglutaryl-CoA dehydratase subunit BcrC/BadD/HgdB
MELLKTNDKEKFFYKYLEVPLKADENGSNLYVSECRRKILGGLSEGYGIDTSDAALRKAVEQHNEVCRIITKMGDLRKEDNPRITGYEFHIICMVSYVCPKYLIIDKLRETLEELKTREPESRFPYRCALRLSVPKLMTNR